MIVQYMIHFMTGIEFKNYFIELGTSVSHYVGYYILFRVMWIVACQT